MKVLLIRIRRNWSIRLLRPLSLQQLENGLWNRRGKKRLPSEESYLKVFRSLLARQVTAPVDGGEPAVIGVNFSFYGNRLRVGARGVQAVWLGDKERHYEGLQGLLDVESRLERFEHRGTPDDQVVFLGRGLLPDGSCEPMDMVAP